MTLAITIISVVILFVWFIFEIVTILSQGLYHFIYGSGYEMLNQELSDCRLNSCDSSIICLRNKSILKGSYIATTKTSIIFPYYISDSSNKDYGIFVFSKSYFLVKRKFKELHQPKSGRIKFD